MFLIAIVFLLLGFVALGFAWLIGPGEGRKVAAQIGIWLFMVSFLFQMLDSMFG